MGKYVWIIVMKLNNCDEMSSRKIWKELFVLAEGDRRLISTLGIIGIFLI